MIRPGSRVLFPRETRVPGRDITVPAGSGGLVILVTNASVSAERSCKVVLDNQDVSVDALWFAWDQVVRDASTDPRIIEQAVLAARNEFSQNIVPNGFEPILRAALAKVEYHREEAMQAAHWFAAGYIARQKEQV